MSVEIRLGSLLSPPLLFLCAVVILFSASQLSHVVTFVASGIDSIILNKEKNYLNEMLVIEIWENKSLLLFFFIQTLDSSNHFYLYL